LKFFTLNLELTIQNSTRYEVTKKSDAKIFFIFKRCDMYTSHHALKDHNDQHRMLCVFVLNLRLNST